MASFDIDSFRANFKSGARAYLFYVTPTFPTSIGADTEQATYLVKASSIPTQTLEEIITNWQGFDYKMAGKYAYADWTVSFNVDKDAKIIQWYYDWQRLIHDPTSNVHSSPADYMVDQQLEMLDLDGTPIAKYKLVGAWAKEIGAITLDYATNEVATFDVTFTYQYHVIDRGAGYAKAVSFAG